MNYRMLLMVLALWLSLPAGAQTPESDEVTAYRSAVKLQSQGRFDEAVLLYKKALKIATKDASYYYSLGTCLQARHDLSDALNSYEKAAELAPYEPVYKLVAAQVRKEMADPFVRHGLNLEQAGLIKEAQVEYEKANRISPGIHPSPSVPHNEHPI